MDIELMRRALMVVSDSLVDWNDMGDVGNAIGYAVGMQIDYSDPAMDKESLLSGIDHGISLADGTHG